MSKHGMRGSPPSVGVSNKKKSGSDAKIVDTSGKAIMKEEVKPDQGDAPILDRRLLCMGNFAIPQSHIRMKLDDLQAFMKDVVVTRAELQITSSGNMMFYTGISPKYFKELPEGVQVPTYDIKMRLDGVFVVEPVRAMQPMPKIMQ